MLGPGGGGAVNFMGGHIKGVITQRMTQKPI
jgi:hypothetical protein